MQFKLVSSFKPTGDQPEAIEKLVSGLNHGLKNQVLLGVTGSGKTYTMAQVIKQIQKPVLVISHNKTLAAQLYQEFRDFFPQNAVSYFVSYYDYYQPEAYLPQTDTYLEKETEINDLLDKLRLQATTNLLTRKDTIIVASVSCIYNLGSPQEYQNYVLQLRLKQKIEPKEILEKLNFLQYERSDYDFTQGTYRVRGERIDIFPAYEDFAYRIILDQHMIRNMMTLDPISGAIMSPTDQVLIYPAKHYLTDPAKHQDAIKQIRQDLALQVAKFKKEKKLVEAQRINQRVNYDLEMIKEVGYVNGIENYGRYFDNRKIGDPPYSLLEYFREPYKNDGWLCFVDESHMTVPQLNGMYNGDRSRKQTLIDFGFRLPAALDNRPLKFEELLRRLPQTIYVSATPSNWEMNRSDQVVEQLVRPTGLVDPQIIVKPVKGQIDDLILEIKKRVAKKERVLVTTLTKKMAEDLAEYLSQNQNVIPSEVEGSRPKAARASLDSSTRPSDSVGMTERIKIAYLHSDVQTLDRQDILEDLRKGNYDVLVGINLLREGLDLPEVSLVAILDADKEGFLRSETSLIQTMGRASRHLNGQVIMYANHLTGSMKRAIDEVNRRRLVQLAYNQKHRITPISISKPIREKLIEREKVELASQGVTLQSIDVNELTPEDRKKLEKKLRSEMNQAARDLDFELAAKLRDKIKSLFV